MIVPEDFEAAFDAIGAVSNVIEDREASPVVVETHAVEHDAESAATPHFDIAFDPFRVVAFRIREVDPEDRYVILATEDFASDPPTPIVYRCGVHNGRPYADPVTEPHAI